MQASKKPGQARKKADLLARQLRSRIVRGELAEGENLPSEAELIAQFGVSRATLREALRILESESLLSVSRGSRLGPLVHRPDPDVAARHVGLILQSQGTTLADVYRARILIEPLAVRVAASEKRGEAAALLRGTVELELQSLEDPPAFDRHEVNFHEVLMEQTGNQTLVLLVKMLHMIFEQHAGSVTAMLQTQQVDTVARRRLAIRAQEKLIRLIEAGDVDMAESFWRLHLSRAAKIMLQDRGSEKVIDVLE